MPSGPGERYDFFLSRRGSVAAIAQEVADVLKESGYEVVVQDYDIQIGESWVLAIHECIKSSRDLIILFTGDYEKSQYTREEFASFWKKQADEPEKHRIIVLRCEDVQPEGLLSHNVFQDLVGVRDAEERKRRIIAAAKRRSAAPPLPPRPFIGVPPRVASFTGRVDELDRLDAILMQDKAAAVTQVAVGRAAVQGMGGVGKTSLAVEYAHRFRGLYAGVCWCPSETRTGLLSALSIVAVNLGASTTEEADVEKAAKAALRRLAEQRATWLLVYDNVPTPDAIGDLLPSAGARVLITSRFSDWSELADEVALDVLPLAEAVALLEGRAGRKDAVGAKTLAEALGCLPLALDHAAAYCKRVQMRFAEYATKASSLMDAAPRGAGYPRSVAATFDLAITEAVAQCPAAEGLMAYFARCAPERIPMMLIEGAVEDEAERLEALAALAEVSLVKHDPFEDGTPAVMVHRLVQIAGRARSEPNGSAQDAVGRLIARLVAVYPEEAYRDPGSWPLCAQLTPHLLAQDYPDDLAEAAGWPDLLNRAARYFHRRVAYSQAAQLFSDALAIRERALGPEHPATAASLHNLARLLHDQGDLAAARPLFERALAIDEKALGPEHPNTASGLHSLAQLLRDQGDLAAARPLVERALAITEKTSGPEHPDTATVLDNLARLLHDQGDLAAARPLVERALAISEQALGREHPYTALYLNNLAALLQHQGDLAAARPLYERALASFEKTLGPEHPDTGMGLHNLANLVQEQADLDGAERLYERALAIWEKALGSAHPSTNRTRCHLARLLLATSQPNEALALGETALANHQKALGPDHTWTKDSARVTADALDALGRTEDAKALRQKYGVTETEKPNSS
jgi:tetratricopeptide (TPR) repeat protein